MRTRSLPGLATFDGMIDRVGPFVRIRRSRGGGMRRALNRGRWIATGRRPHGGGVSRWFARGSAGSRSCSPCCSGDRPPAPSPRTLQATRPRSRSNRRRPRPRRTTRPRRRAPKPPTGVGRQSILALFARANPMLWLLGLCSIVTVGYTLERLIGLRRGRVIPPRLCPPVPRTALHRQARPRPGGRTLPGQREPGGPDLRPRRPLLGSARLDDPPGRRPRLRP